MISFLHTGTAFIVIVQFAHELKPREFRIEAIGTLVGV